ncbi:MAG TPA: DUF2332 family protein [Allosphingosinicella sp.]|jgi:hypothetical protein
MSEKAVRAAFAEQVGWCGRLGSPFTALLCQAVGERIDHSTAVGRRVLDWVGDSRPEKDNVPARLTGAFHWLVRRGAAPELAALYPPAALPQVEALWAAAAPLLETHRDVFDSFLDNPPQTNEVGRSAVLMSGLLVVAGRFGLPMRLFELGSSAGLNLGLDRYRYALGGLETGDAGSPLLLKPAWTGPPPPSAGVRILERRGVDISPLDVARDGERLLAFVWADQRERIARLEAALSIAAADPPQVEQGDAAAWLERVLPAAPREGSVRVVLHSIAFQYFPAETQARIARLMERLGAEAHEGAPLAWLQCEHLPGDAQASLRLRCWPDGTERQLAWAHGHGASVEWLP